MSEPDDTRPDVTAPETGLSLEWTLDEYDGSDEYEHAELTASPRQQMSVMARAITPAAKTLRQQAKRNWLAAWALYLAEHRGNCGYRQYRPVDVNRALTIVSRQYVTFDCSAMCQWLYARGNVAFRRSGGLPDPSRFGHTGYGNTTSQEAHGKKVTVPAKGDLSFYDGHVALVVHSVPDNPNRSVVVSHGSEVGPLILPANYRGDHHGFRRYF